MKTWPTAGISTEADLSQTNCLVEQLHPGIVAGAAGKHQRATTKLIMAVPDHPDKGQGNQQQECL